MSADHILLHLSVRFGRLFWQYNLCNNAKLVYILSEHSVHRDEIQFILFESQISYCSLCLNGKIGFFKTNSTELKIGKLEWQH